ncbi:MAG: hypothetical protein AMJ81_02155 [Phycisphaerae bacterium SM23_33]|nr:MAG: hypothetical protein AMJ81_02155 [Phycisphaerae bacterium SM23_33]
MPVRRETLRLPDGCETLLLRHVPPASADRGLPVLYVHGIQSHPGWFMGSAQALARAGGEVFQVTRRGSGEAAVGRGDAASAGQLLDDLTAAVDHVTARTGAERLALVGVSWGGKLLVAWALEAPRPAASLTLVAPGIVPIVDLPLRTKLGIAAAGLCCPRSRFDIPLNDVSLFTDDSAMREYLRGDRHRLHRATARFLVASAMLDRRLARAPKAALRLPTTLLLARRDRIINNAATRDALERLTGGRVKVFELDAAHTIEFEPDPAAFHRLLCQAVGER